ncbi:MAG: endonuclease/exonuclease/phosphatase family protein [Acidimicrobiales bacterium]
MRRIILIATTLVLVAAAAGCRDPESVRVVTYNLLHGLSCPSSTDFCKAPARVHLLTHELEAADCPELVGLQEVAPRQEELLPPALESICDGEYEIAYVGANPFDNPMILTRLPVVEQGQLDIANFPWDAYWVRVDSPLGPIEFLTAHFASSVNNPPCDETRCPPICPTGISTNECHAREVVEFFAGRPDDAVRVVSGDLNALPGSTTLTTFTDAGYVDGWLEWKPECDPATEQGCTGATEDPPGDLMGLDTVEGFAMTERIDYALVRPPATCDLRYLGASSFAGEPADPPEDGMYWASDHVGLTIDLKCA